MAIVNGLRIPTAEIDAMTEGLVRPVRQQMDRLREQTLENEINKRLIELAAEKRGLTTTAFIREEVVEKVADPTESEIRTFYERNRAGLPQPYDEVRDGLFQYIRGQRQQVEMTLLSTRLRSEADVQILDYSPTAPATPEDRAKVLATVNGTKITSGDIETALKPYLYEFRKKIYEIEMSAVEAKVDDVLIRQEAARRNVPIETIIDTEIGPRVRKLDVFDASKFYNDNKEQFEGRSFQDVRDDLLAFLQEREILKAKHTYAETLRKNAVVQVNLVEPAPPTFAIDISGRPIRGGTTAAVTVVVFSDFECARCALTHGVLDRVVEHYNGKVRLVARYYPLEQHAHAFKAAEAAEAAHEQGKYWEYASVLYSNQKALTVDKLKEYASQVGLDRAKFDAALDSGRFATEVDRDLNDGARIGISGTPAIYVNGRAVYDDTEEGLKAAIDRALRDQG